MRSLLERRLVIVTGKGGTGKTTVAAALALAGARSGRRVLLAELGRDEQLPRLFEAGDAEGSRPARRGGSAPARMGYAGRTLATGLTGMRIDPYDALAEYLGIQLGVRTLVEWVLRNRAFRQLLEASPGWRDLIALGKIWHLERMKQADGAPQYDLLVVDAPSTGHGLAFLDVPRVVVSAVRAGPLHRHAGWVEEMIEDPARTILLPVTLAEELPARETVELVERAREQAGVAVDRVVVNGIQPRPFPPGLPTLDRLLAALPRSTRLPGLPPAPVLAACAAHLRARFELNERFVGEIARATGLPVLRLPYVSTGIHGPTDLELLGAALLAAPEAIAA